ncbi:unnamed protein product [Brassica oleracea]|uniref:Uncharacterized protein n=1 Tax=Brassica cretica TaxID=69181 RepID=A0A8S9P0R8_BRACR|nr:hypothetical protein F2Q69_00002581 [Brassica cretica]
MSTSGPVSPSPPFPFRLFAIGEEPLGIRDTPYHKHFFISKILNALDEDEVKVLSDSPFEKLVKFAEKSSFSGWFGHVGVGGSGCGALVAATASPAGGGAVVAAPATEEKKYEPTGDSYGDLRFGLILA